MLDQLNYSQSNGIWTKIITNIITDVVAETVALQTQLAAFQEGQLISPSDEIAAAIINYQQQIAVLQG